MAGLGYADGAVPPGAVGIGSLVVERSIAAQHRVSGFFVPWRPSLWAAGREEPQGSPALYRYFRLSFGRPPNRKLGWRFTTATRALP